MRRLTARAFLATTCLALPPLFALLFCACGVDGKTPNCADPNARCEPSAENLHADATIDAKDSSLRPETTTEGSTPDVVDAGDSGDADGGDARLDADAKTG